MQILPVISLVNHTQVLLKKGYPTCKNTISDKLVIFGKSAIQDAENVWPTSLLLSFPFCTVSILPHSLDTLGDSAYFFFCNMCTNRSSGTITVINIRPTWEYWVFGLSIIWYSKNTTFLKLICFHPLIQFLKCSILQNTRQQSKPKSCVTLSVIYHC